MERVWHGRRPLRCASRPPTERRSRSRRTSRGPRRRSARTAAGAGTRASCLGRPRRRPRRTRDAPTATGPPHQRPTRTRSPRKPCPVGVRQGAPASASEGQRLNFAWRIVAIPTIPRTECAKASSRITETLAWRWTYGHHTRGTRVDRGRSLCLARHVYDEPTGSGFGFGNGIAETCRVLHPPMRFVIIRTIGLWPSASRMPARGGGRLNPPANPHPCAPGTLSPSHER